MASQNNDIEKNTITIGKAASLLAYMGSLIVMGAVAYFAAMNGVRDGFDKVNERINIQERRIDAVESENRYFKEKFDDYKDVFNKLRFSAAVKPEEIRRKEYTSDNERN